MPKPVAKPIIAVDIDEVLFPLVDSLIVHIDKAHGINVSRDDFKTYDLEDVWQLNNSQVQDIIDRFLHKQDLLVAPVNGAIDAIKKLKKKYEVIVITSRDSNFAASTNEWLTQHFPELFNGVHLLGNPKQSKSYRSKGEVCRELGVSCLIDDSLHNIENVSEEGIDTILFGDYPWNVTEKLPDKCRKANNWTEVLELLNG